MPTPLLQASIPPADLVGDAFVQQYYHILLQTPELVYRFYQDVSKLGRPQEDGIMTTTTTLHAINEKILSFGEKLKAEITKVDSQESYNGGVLVVVTGYLARNDNLRQKFSQSFFLAPQEKGYFVLNDIFRYVDDAERQHGNQNPVNDIEAPLTPKQDSFPIQENYISKPTALSHGVNGEEVGNPPENAAGSVREKEVPMPEVVDKIPDNSQMVGDLCLVAKTNTRTKEVPNLPQGLLESLFSFSKSSESEPNTINWRNMVKKMQSLGLDGDVFPSSDAVACQDIYARGDEYNLLRESAQQHWDSRKLYYEKAAATYSKGQRQYAAYLSDQGQRQAKLAQKEDQRASRDIFEARNKDRGNVVTIDFHGQHVKPAIRILKCHLLFGTYFHSIQTLKVITGRGLHSGGKSKIKEKVIEFLKKNGIEWREENQGVVSIELNGYKEFSFPDSDSDTD